MNKEAQSILVTLFGGLLIGITASGKFTSYVKPGFGPLLLAAGVVLVLVGVLSLLQTIVGEVRRAKATALAEEAAGRPVRSGLRAHAPHGGPGDAELDAHGHAHTRSRAPWLILAPVLLLLIVSPTALGADAVSRNAGSQAVAGLDAAPAAATVYEGYAPNDGSGSAKDSSGRRTLPFGPLPSGTDPVVLLKEFVLRALYDADNSVTRTPVTLVGFIAPAGDGFTSGYTLARLSINCCAADANPVRVHIEGDPPFPENTWVAVVATAVEGTGGTDNDYVPTARITSIGPVQQPPDPYEH